MHDRSKDRVPGAIVTLCARRSEKTSQVSECRPVDTKQDGRGRVEFYCGAHAGAALSFGATAEWSCLQV